MRGSGFALIAGMALVLVTACEKEHQAPPVKETPIHLATPVRPQLLAVDAEFFQQKITDTVTSSDGRLRFVTRDTGMGGTMPHIITEIFDTQQSTQPIQTFDDGSRMGWVLQAILLEEKGAPYYMVTTWDKFSSSERATAISFWKLEAEGGLSSVPITAPQYDFAQVWDNRLSFHYQGWIYSDRERTRMLPKVVIRCDESAAGTCTLGVARELTHGPKGAPSAEFYAVKLEARVESGDSVSVMLSSDASNWDTLVLKALEPY